jgi:hypothetical protein
LVPTFEGKAPDLDVSEKSLLKDKGDELGSLLLRMDYQILLPVLIDSFE